MKTSGQIVLFRFPRTDLAAGKLRPAQLIPEAPGPYDDWLISRKGERAPDRGQLRALLFAGPK